MFGDIANASRPAKVETNCYYARRQRIGFVGASRKVFNAIHDELTRSSHEPKCPSQ